MKNLKFFKILIDLFFYFSLLSITIMLVILMKGFLGYETRITIGGNVLTSNNFTDKVIILFDFIGSTIFIYSIYILRKLALIFISKNIFNIEVVQNLNKIGKILLTSTMAKLIAFVIFYFSYMFNKQHVDNFWLNIHFPTLALALFFMFLSEVFKIAKTIKEENELTV